MNDLSSQYAVPYNEIQDAMKSIEWWALYYKLPPDQDRDLETLRAALDLAAQGANLSQTANSLARDRYLPAKHSWVTRDPWFYLVLALVAAGGLLVLAWLLSNSHRFGM